jgi:tRNA A37 threonylcarbamoyladenosine synthetase subunit TsaC/SUA5/YrdC
MLTETVYGPAAGATNGVAVSCIYEANGRRSFNPSIVHVLDLAVVEQLECSTTARAGRGILAKITEFVVLKRAHSPVESS